MAQFDATTKHLFDNYLDHLLALSVRRVQGRVEIRDSDLSTVTAAADKVLFIHDDPPWILNAEPVSSRMPELVSRVNMYGAILEHRHKVLVWTMVLLLRPEADAPELTGLLAKQFPDEAPYRTLRYEVVRLWELPLKPEAVLRAIREAEERPIAEG